MSESSLLQSLAKLAKTNQLTSAEENDLTKLIKYVGEDAEVDIDYDELSEIMSDDDEEYIEGILNLSDDLGLFKISHEDGIIINDG